MATLSLGVSKAPPSVVAMPAVGMVAIKVGAASLYVEQEEADRLALDIQQAALELRSSAAVAA
ncbi:hypothetical protein [Stenotrophomonas pavanii]|uniref:hypothetical protein n=1 Tax=Stenotrophomonas pavanii TaxID=487698 RepID=UPI00088EA0DF|nr:hypothetical protein [Stenotrophomonas pavanii]SDK55370.1 hypothetical protein SAMN04487784_2553 [Stenotrophomonas pavanii]